MYISYINRKRLIPPNFEAPEPVELKNLSSAKVDSMPNSSKDVEAEPNGHIEEDSKLLSNKKTVVIVAAEGK